MKRKPKSPTKEPKWAAEALVEDAFIRRGKIIVKLRRKNQVLVAKVRRLQASVAYYASLTGVRRRVR